MTTTVTAIAVCVALGFMPGMCKAEMANEIHISTGIASQYSGGVMERVIRVRQAGRTVNDLPLIIPNVDGYIAVLNGRNIGQIYYIRPVGNKKWERFWVVDCAGRTDGGYEFMVNGGRIRGKWYPILVEVDWETAVRWRTVGKGILIEILR